MITDTTRTRVAEAIDGLPLRTELITAGDRTGPGFALAQTLELAASPAEVWAHLTDPALLARWSPIVPDRPLDSVGAAESRENPGDDPVDVERVVGADAMEVGWEGLSAQYSAGSPRSD